MKNSYKIPVLIFLLIQIFHFTITADNICAQWVQLGSVGGGKVEAFLVSESNIFAGTSGPGIGIYLSSNNGANWTAVNNGLPVFDPYSSITSLAILNNNIFAGTSDSGIYMSTNNGNSWSAVSNGLPTNIRYPTLLVTGSNIFVGTIGSGVFLSTNNGANWTAVNNGLPSLSVWSLAVLGPNIFAGSRYNGGKVFKSTNNGSSWTASGNGLQNNNNNEVRALAVLGSDIYAACDNEDGIFKSTNNGNNWFPVNNGIPTNPSMTSLAVYGTNIFAGCFEGVYLSTNNGSTWIEKNQGFNELFVISMLVTGNYIFAGMYSSSLMRRTYSEIIGVQNISTEIPNEFSLSQNYPNPFNPTTNIEFSLPEKSFVKLKIFNITGKEVAELVNENLSAGTFRYEFNAENLPSGLYFYKLESSKFSETKKMIILK